MTRQRVVTLVGCLLMTAACAPAPSQAAPPAAAPSTLAANLAPTAPPAPEQPATTYAPTLITDAITSSTGATLDLPRLSHGARCLRLNVALHGIPLPAGAPPDYEPPMPTIMDAVIFIGGSELELEPRGGGGGGGGDGRSFDIGQEMVYALRTPLPPDVSVPMVLELTLEPSLGFAAPLSFALQAQPDVSAQCGLQGSDAP